jgi:hypothetical protein
VIWWFVCRAAALAGGFLIHVVVVLLMTYGLLEIIVTLIHYFNFNFQFPILFKYSYEAYFLPTAPLRLLFLETIVFLMVIRRRYLVAF